MADLKGYAKLIHEALPEAPIGDLARIEDIMRHDIVHSTLDWLSLDAFNKAAKDAFDVFLILKSIGVN